ncbi:hypothetical protein TNCV_4891631 [Trichonephila clavipes]|nr:hypothetical protein TNCV_4891631 [Trichonephila clavipes]
MHDTTPNRGVSGWVSLAAHVIGAGMPDVLQPGTLRWFEKRQDTPSFEYCQNRGIRLPVLFSVPIPSHHDNQGIYLKDGKPCVLVLRYLIASPPS